LCEGCRSQFVNYPIPNWIKAFGIGIVVLMVVSLVSLPRQINTGIHLKRGIAASKEHRYVTAQKELQMVVDQESHYTEAQCRLLIAAFYNMDLSTVATCYKKLEHEKVEDEALFQSVTDVLSKMGTFVPTDSFAALQNKKPEGLTETDYVNYFGHSAHDVYAMEGYAQLLMDQNKFAAADSVLNEVLRDNPNHYAALAIKVPLKREQQQFDSSYFFVDQMLALNKEDAFALSSKARVLLKQHKDKEAFEVGQQSLALNPTSAYGLASMALVYHYKKDILSRDALITRAQKDSSLMESFKYVNDIISGKEKFRD
jgi:tetratricopeptide (TPR) repeat protein